MEKGQYQQVRWSMLAGWRIKASVGERIRMNKNGRANQDWRLEEEKKKQEGGFRPGAYQKKKEGVGGVGGELSKSSSTFDQSHGINV